MQAEEAPGEGGQGGEGWEGRLLIPLHALMQLEACQVAEGGVGGRPLGREHPRLQVLQKVQLQQLQLGQPCRSQVVSVRSSGTLGVMMHC